ncbi:MAG: M12 family metallo-peptidase [bacterium]
MRHLIPSLLLSTISLSAAASAQDVVTFPFDALGGTPLVTGTTEYQPDARDLWGLVASSDLIMRDVPLPGYSSVELVLERIEADYTRWGIQVDGVPSSYDSLNQTIWKGTVTGDSTSEVSLILSSYGCYGWIATGGEVYHLLPFLQPGLDWDSSSVRIVSETIMRTTGTPKGAFCLADTSRPIGQPGPPTYNNPVGQTLECKQSVETDFQFYNQWGNLAAAQNYLTALLGAISDRYATQINVVITYPYLQFYTNSNDPWTSQGGGPGATLTEFRNAWAGNIPAGGHLAHFVSGVNGGGVAYLDVLCSQNWGFGVSFGVDGGVNFPVSQGNNTWDFVVIAHETGHNFGTPHTHDFCPTPLDRCAPSGYFGSCQSSQQCTNQGTVMSYCHLCGGGMNNITTFFHTQVETLMRNEAVNSCIPACNGCGGGGGCNDDSHEPNGNCAEAVTRGVGTTTGLVVDGSDRDFWHVDVPAGSTLTIDLTFTHSNGNINTFLYDNCFGNAGSGTSSNNNEQVTWTNTANNTVPIYVDVFLASGTGCNQYELGVGIASDPCNQPDDAYEDNDSCAQAVAWANGIELSMFVSMTDKDYFSFCVADGGTFDLNLFFDTNTADIDAYLYTAAGCDGLPVAQASTTSNNESLSWTNSTGSDAEMILKVEVWSLSVGLCNDYVMQTTGIGGTCGGGGGPGAIGSRYCDPAVGNSSGLPGRIDATGQLDVFANDLTLTASQLPTNQFGYFLASMTPAAISGPGGSMGVLCVGGSIARFVTQLGNTGASGQLQAVIDLTMVPANPMHSIAPGETWNFTSWFRDVLLIQTSNFTDGVRITFQ